MPSSTIDFVKAFIALSFSLLLNHCCLAAAPVLQDTLVINQKEAEGLFLNNNLDLIVQKLNINQAEAQVIQAKLWPNPEFSVDEVNLWATKNQLSSGEKLPPIIGNFGKNQQFSAALEQRIETAGKRKKRIALESVSREIAAEYYSELLRNLKTELRKNIFALSYKQTFLTVLNNQNAALAKLLAAFENQFNQNNISKVEIFRLKALKLELGQQILENRNEMHGVQKELSVLLNIPSQRYIQADIPIAVNLTGLNSRSLDNLQFTAVTNRPDGKISFLKETLASKKYDLEYAQRKPDLTLGANYDRGGNFLLNFIGFGFKMDLPVFNRNQGNILESKIGIEKSKVLSEQKTKGIETEVTQVFRTLQNSLQAYQALDLDYVRDLDQVFQTYTDYFMQRRINMIEYLDFFDAYLSNKRTILTTTKQLNDSLEDLNFVTASEIH
ncbi:TolC family protein [Dyadobacter sp. LHD-138]|uniref:TolC family protein n=1 Tax=Dyadobacter sp. LHD-138 TaxID=3071413 RepID=UPI0027E01A41|nr:TolC family protein [Dyadobacter sp. LHD-138]MDQ6478151.1 TolC family protein [Dyadobacter sp. LHD-138]